MSKSSHPLISASSLFISISFSYVKTLSVSYGLSSCMSRCSISFVIPFVSSVQTLSMKSVCRCLFSKVYSRLTYSALYLVSHFNTFRWTKAVLQMRVSALVSLSQHLRRTTLRYKAWVGRKDGIQIVYARVVHHYKNKTA